MVGEILGLPFPRNAAAGIRPSILHGHYLHDWGMQNPVIVWRDGRDVMLSLYYHCLFLNERENGDLVKLVRRELDFDVYEDVRANLPRFIEYSFGRLAHPRFSWAAFVDKWAGHRNAIHTRYEDLRTNGKFELSRVIRELRGIEPSPAQVAEVLDRFSFERQAHRRVGEMNTHSFMRKGLVGDWRENFSHEARQIFNHYAGAQLVALEYEPDRKWIES